MQLPSVHASDTAAAFHHRHTDLATAPIATEGNHTVISKRVLSAGLAAGARIEQGGTEEVGMRITCALRYRDGGLDDAPVRVPA